MLQLTFIISLVIIGLVLGSFINALVWRLKNNMNFVNARSVCTSCKKTLAAKDLVPILSWLTLGGKCRYCHTKISISYPIVELVTAIAVVLSGIFWPMGLSDLPAVLFFLSWLAQLTVLIALGLYDIKWQILPNKLIIIAISFALIDIVMKIIAGSTLATLATDAFGGVLVGSGLFFLLFQVSSGRWIGGGDVKLGFYAGLALGWTKSLIAITTAFYSAFLFVVPLLLLRVVKRKSKIAFGPFIIFGIIVAKLGGELISKLVYSL